MTHHLLQRPYNSKVKSSHHKHHKNQEHQEIPQPRHMPQTCHHPSVITFGLLQLTAIRTTRFQHKHTTKSPEQCSKISTGKNANQSSMENTKQLHWLPIKQCIDYKVLTLVHKCCHHKAPNYLQDLLTEKSVRRQGLQSENLTQQLEVPHTKNKTFASQRFSLYAPTKWNKLPNTIRDEPNYDKFKTLLKTHLFNQAYNQ